METKPLSIAVITDDNAQSSGFALVAREIFPRVQKLLGKKVDIWQVGLFPVGDEDPRAIPSHLNVSEDSGMMARLDVYGASAYISVLNRKEREQPDIIFLLGDHWYWSTTFLSRDWRKQHNLLSKVWYYCPIDGVQLNPMVHQVYKGADLCISMSPFGTEQLRKLTGKEPFYMPHGRDPVRFAHHERPLLDGQMRFGVVARNSERKRLWAILRAFSILPKDIYTNSSLLMHVPEGDSVGGNIWEYTKYFGIERVEFTGKIKIEKHGRCHTPMGCPDDEMAEIYHAIDCLVSSGREGFGLPILEARSTGCQLIIPDYSAPASLEYEGAIVYKVKHHKVDPMSRDILDMAADPDAICEAMIQAWEELHQKRPAPLDRVDLEWDTIARQLADRIEADGRSIQLQHCREAHATLQDRTPRVQPKILVVMPEAHGDVLLLTGTLSSLRMRYSGLQIVVATGEPYKVILEGCPNVDQVITYNPYLHDRYMELHDEYEAVFTPHFATQRAANWVHGGHCRTLAEVYANDCNVELGPYYVNAPESYEPLGNMSFITLHTGNGKANQAARAYPYWSEVIDLLIEDESLPMIVLIGGKDDLPVGDCRVTADTSPERHAHAMKAIDSLTRLQYGPDEPCPIGDFKGPLNLRGLTSIPDMFSLLRQAELHVGIDSFPMHAAAILGTHSVIIWGNTFPNATGPDRNLQHLMHPVLPESYAPCIRPCHETKCRHGNACLRTISPETIAQAVRQQLKRTKRTAPERA